MIGKDFEAFPINIRIECVDAFYDGEHFGIRGTVSNLGSFQFLAEIRNGVRLAFDTLQRQAPMATFEASICTSKGMLNSGLWSIGANTQA